MMRFTTPRPVYGSEHSVTTLYDPSFAMCSISTITRLAPCTRSIAPPIPLTILPGIIQLARSPVTLTCMAPRIAASMWPPRIMPKLVAESKYAAPGSTVTVSLPALIRSGSCSPSHGYGPTPRMPFSLCSTTVTPVGRKLGTNVGRPMPRLTYCPSASSAAALAAICSRVSPIAASAFLPGSHGAPLDPLLDLGAHRHDTLHEDAGQVDLVRAQLARLHQVLDLGDGHPSGHRAQRVEVARRLVEDQVAVPVADERVHHTEVAADGLLKHVGAVAELPGVLGR